MAKEQKILIARRAEIEENRLTAELLLQNRPFLKGEYAMVNYYKDPDFRTNVGVLIAIGVKNGTGEDCFRIVSMGGEVPISGVTQGNAPTDVSNLYWNNLYLHISTEGKVYYTYKSPRDQGTNGTLVLEEIQGGPFIFQDLTTGYRWFYINGTLKREDDYHSSTELIHLVEEVQNSGVNINVTPLGGSDMYSGSGAFPISISATDSEGNSLIGTEGCSIYIGDRKLGPNDDPNNFSIYPSANQDTTYTIRVVYEVDGVRTEYTETFTVYAPITVYYVDVNEGWSPQDIIYYRETETTQIRSCDNHVAIKWNLSAGENPSSTLKIPVIRTNREVKHIYDYSGLDYIEDYNYLALSQEGPYIYWKKTGFVASNFLQDFWFIDKE
jgi:hypothetical protein